VRSCGAETEVYDPILGNETQPNTRTLAPVSANQAQASAAAAVEADFAEWGLQDIIDEQGLDAWGSHNFTDGSIGNPDWAVPGSFGFTNQHAPVVGTPSLPGATRHVTNPQSATAHEQGESQRGTADASDTLSDGFIDF